jgi:4-hydroxy-3-polyprenylbenzoate decarboxylase
MSADDTRRVIVAVTGASGVLYATRILQLLHSAPGYEAHLIVSSAGAVTLWQETRLKPSDLSALAAVTYRNSDIGAAIASGSFPTSGMIVAPCSIRTLAAVANCDNSTLVARAADVCLKEGRPLLLMVRETPLHKGHLRLMSEAADAGAIIAPPVPAFYTRPTSIADLVDHTARRMLQRLGVSALAPEPWSGLRNDGNAIMPDDAQRLLHGRRKEGSHEPSGS